MAKKTSDDVMITPLRGGMEMPPVVIAEYGAGALVFAAAPDANLRAGDTFDMAGRSYAVLHTFRSSTGEMLIVLSEVADL